MDQWGFYGATGIIKAKEEPNEESVFHTQFQSTTVSSSSLEYTNFIFMVNAEIIMK